MLFTQGVALVLLLALGDLVSAQLSAPPGMPLLNVIGPFSLQVFSQSPAVNETFVAIDQAGRLANGNAYYGIFSATSITYNTFYLNNTAGDASVATQLIAEKYAPYGASISQDVSNSTVQAIEFIGLTNETSPDLFSLNAQGYLLYGGESKWLSCDLGFTYARSGLFQLAWNWDTTDSDTNCVDVGLLCVL